MSDNRTTKDPTPTSIQLARLHEQKRVRVTRTLVYEGPAGWLSLTFLNAALPMVGESRISLAPDRSIVCTAETIEELT